MRFKVSAVFASLSSRGQGSMLVVMILAIAACGVPSTARAIAAIEHAISDAQEAANRNLQTGVELSRLQKTIDEGKEAIAELRAQSGRLQQEKAALERQNAELQNKKADLERIQTALTSGLIAAVIAALVAIAGSILKTLSSKVDRDFRQLEVIEKIAALGKEGVQVPARLASEYSGSESN